MTVAELIEKLQQFDQNLPVMTHGSNGDSIEDIGEPRIAEVGEYIYRALASEMRYTDLVHDGKNNEPVRKWSAVIIDYEQ